MSRRYILIGSLFTIAGIIIIGLAYIAFEARGTLQVLLAGEAGSAIDATADSSEPEAIPDRFAAQFNSSLDTSREGPWSFITDTSLHALPREHVPGGRKVSIAICGVDSRLSERVEHADANHVVTLWLDSGCVDIISIPRDTPCDAGYGGSARQNTLTNLRARKGRDVYLKEVAAIAGLDTIEYYVDLGFSQARGILELLGHGERASSTLRILRTRRIFSTGDFQRSFNQGQFIRQTLLREFGRLDGISGRMLLRGGLCLVTTNLTADVVERLHEELRGKGFPRNGEDVTVAIKPAYYAKMVVFNFGDSTSMANLVGKIEEKASALGITPATRDSAMLRFRRDLDRLVANAVADSAKLPVRVVATLRRPFEQRVWWQISDRSDRGMIRRAIGSLLADAYARTGKMPEAARVREVMRFEEEMRF